MRSFFGAVVSCEEGGAGMEVSASVLTPTVAKNSCFLSCGVFQRASG
jgi:hypothetical protein